MRFAIRNPGAAAALGAAALLAGALGPCIARAQAYTPPLADDKMTSTASGVFLYCLAFGNLKVVRSDLIPLARRPKPVVEKAWESYVRSEYPDVGSRQCLAAKSPGKAAAYSERDARVRELLRMVGTATSINTGWSN